MSMFAPKAQLAAVAPHWGGYYTQVARDVIAGRWKVAPVWGGLRSGMVGLAAFDPRLPARQTKMLEAARRSITEERGAVFAAPLVDQAGRTRLERGALDDDAIARMDWLVQGVIGNLPKQ
jgi:simple sugar transport system substrate-binding protein